LVFTDHLSTATISYEIEAHIDGVGKQAAKGLHDKILQMIQQKISKNKSSQTIPPENNLIS